MESRVDGFSTDGAARQRDEARRDVLIPATIRCPDGDVIPCILRDMSARGAKLSVARRHSLPVAFTLSVPGHDTPYPVRRVWRRADAIGVILDLPRTAEA